jgi:hypothetical protein
MIIRAPYLLNRWMTKMEPGLLINFNVPVLKYGIKRVVLTR